MKWFDAFFVLVAVAALSSAEEDKSNADLCYEFPCEHDMECQLTNNGRPTCVCKDPKDCPPCDVPPRIGCSVCSTWNETFESHCVFSRNICLLRKGGAKRVPHVDYPGECQMPHPCTPERYDSFRGRMMEWLRRTEKYEESGTTDEATRPEVPSKEWLCDEWKRNQRALKWEFQKLDTNKNKIIDDSEMHALRRQILRYEVCTRKFFTRCAGKDKKINKDEWFACFGHPEREHSPCM